MKNVYHTFFVFLAVVTITFTEGVEAYQDFVPQGMAACAQEIAQHCRGIKPGGGRILKCLLDAPSLSDECNAAVRPTDGAAGDLSITVTINGIHSKSGFVLVTLGDDPKTFPAGRRMVTVPATGSTVTAIFKHLKPGTYSVTAFHDENDNSKFDAGFTGVEGFAPSNGAIAPPSFEKSAVKVSRDTALALTMYYF